MIDTVILRIHDVRKYRSILKTLDPADSKGYSTQSGKVNAAEIERLRDQGYHSPSEMLDILKLHRTGEFLVKTRFAKHQNASNHYSFAYMVNHTANYIEFNFSIPKYIYGSNVLMFVDHIGHRNFSFTDCQHLEYNCRRAVDKLERFLNEFFKQSFPLTHLDYRDVELNRIDVCFNQLFRSKDECLKYLSYQKRKQKKHSRDNGKSMRDWDTSLMYTTDRYSAKIYHKGSEYKKNDLKEHLKINREKGRQYFRTAEYQAFADKILRYELTIRNQELNYLHKHHIFRKKCPHFRRYLKVYQEVENAIQTNDRISKRIGELPEEAKAAYRKEHPYIHIEPDARKVHKWISKLLSKKTLFKLAVDEEVEQYNKTLVHYDCSEAKFSRELLLLCFDKLISFMEEYQIKELPPEEHIEKLVRHYNERHRNKLPLSNMLGFYADLLKLGSFKEAARLNYHSRATMFRYKERFRKIGITESNLIPLTEDGIPLAELNLRDYHYEHLNNRHFLSKNTFLDLEHEWAQNGKPEREKPLE
jgi:hypothetical protein